MTPWFLSSEFGSLALSSRVIVVELHVLAIALVALWGKKLDARLSRRAVISPPKNKVEEGKGATSGQYEDYGVQEPFKEVAIRQELSSKVCDTTEGVVLYHSPDDNRDNQGQHKSPVHANGIIDRVKMLCQSIKRRTLVTCQNSLDLL